MDSFAPPPLPADDRPARRCDRSWSGSRAIFGLFLFAFGALLLLDRFDLVRIDHWAHFWPLFPIAIGVVKVIQPKREGQRFFGALLIVIFGAILLRHWVDFPIRGDLIAPGVLLLIGLRLMLVPRRSWRRRPAVVGSGDEVGTFALLGSSKVVNTSSSFDGGQASAVLGACELDLRGASIAEGGEAVLDVFAFWGGIDILVPAGWAVVVSGTPILGAIEDQRPAPAVSTGTLVIKGLVVMGGVEIRNERKRDY